MDVFCMWQPNNLLHEVYGTEFCLLYPEAVFIRGFDVDQDILPDIEMRLEGELFYVEIDTGSVPYRKQKARWKKYENFEGVLLVVTLSDSRLRGLQVTAEGIENALFTTLHQVTGDPFGPVWANPKGDMFSIQQQC